MKNFRDFESAREFVRNLELKNYKEWLEYCKSGEKPDDIPANLDTFYKNKGWTAWGDFLGTGNVANKDKTYRPFKETREFVRALNLKSQKEWQKYCKSGNKPDDIPQDLVNTYKNKGWKGFGDFLGTRNVATRSAVYLTFNDCRKFVQNLHLSGQDEWIKYCKFGKKPSNVPASPWKVYNNNGWTNMGDFFGTGNISNSKKQFRPFKEARDFVRTLKLKGKKEWEAYCNSGNKPDDIPSAPWSTYKEWKKK